MFDFDLRRARGVAIAVVVLSVVGCDRPTTLAGGPVPKGGVTMPASAPAPATTSTTASTTPPVRANASPLTLEDDGYDLAKMDFKPGPAKLTSDRHTGPFAAGDALSMDGTVKPLVASPVKEIRLDTSHKVIDLAPGVKFTAWTFGDQVPGPVVRARVGDRIKFSMTNRSDEHAPGLDISPPMMHSMDFHSAMVSPQDKYRSIAPGKTISFEFTPNYPGVFMYHCGTPMVLEHIASGM